MSHLFLDFDTMASSYNKSSASRTGIDKHNSKIFLDFIRSLPNDVFLLSINELQKTLYLSDSTTPLIKYISVYQKNYVNLTKTILKFYLKAIILAQTITLHIGIIACEKLRAIVVLFISLITRQSMS